MCNCLYLKLCMCNITKITHTKYKLGTPKLKIRQPKTKYKFKKQLLDVQMFN